MFGCDKCTPTIRALVRVVINKSNGTSERYVHKLCGRCVFCIHHYENRIFTASKGQGVASFLFALDYRLQEDLK